MHREMLRTWPTRPNKYTIPYFRQHMAFRRSENEAQGAVPGPGAWFPSRYCVFRPKRRLL